MSATAFSVSAVLKSIGVARVFMGDLLTVGGTVALPTEGEITVPTTQTLNVMTAPEFTGDVPHDAWVLPGDLVITVPVIYGGTQTLGQFSAHAAASEGYSNPKRPTFTSLAIVPLIEMDTQSPPQLSYNGTVWVPATPPVHALWFWKVVPLRPDLRLAFDNGGKVILPVSFRVFFDATKPEGHKIFTQGNPVTAGVTLFRL